MVPSDANIFFNDVLKSGVPADAIANAKVAQQAAEAEEDPENQNDDPPAPAQQAAGRKVSKNR